MAKQPGKFKLSEAINPKGAPPAGTAETVEGRPGDAREPKPSVVAEQNAERNPNQKDRLIDMGRGNNIAGRQPRSHEKHGD
jgi:hypothetical protein